MLGEAARRGASCRCGGGRRRRRAGGASRSHHRSAIVAAAARVACLESPPVPGQPLRLLGVADGRSINVARWARRLVERGHEVHARLATACRPAARRSRASTVHDVRELERLTRVRGLRREHDRPGGRTPRRAARRRPRPRALPSSLRLVGGPRGAASARDEPVEPRRLRRRERAPPGAPARDRGDRRVRLPRRQLGGEPPRVDRPRRRSGAHPRDHLVLGARPLRTGPRRPRRSARVSAGPRTPSSSSRCATTARTRTSTSSFARSPEPPRDEPRARLLLAARGGPTRTEIGGARRRARHPATRRVRACRVGGRCPASPPLPTSP